MPAYASAGAAGCDLRAAVAALAAERERLAAAGVEVGGAVKNVLAIATASTTVRS